MKRAITAGLFALLPIPAALAATPVADLAKPPANAEVWELTSVGGGHHGQEAHWVSEDGTHWSRFSMNLRGQVTELDQQMRLAPDGSIRSLVVRGFVPEGDAAESFESANGTYHWQSPVDHGSGKSDPHVMYAAFGGTTDSFLPLIQAMIKAPDHSIGLLPGGRATLETLTTLTVSHGKDQKTLTCYGITGFGFSPFPVWMDGDRLFGTVGALDGLPKGWSEVSSQLVKAQDEALAKRAPALVASLGRKPAGPVAFTQVRLYDADARSFRDGMTVVVSDGRITAVGSDATVPAGAQVIDGRGKTLLPGLWDNHQHYGDDSTGPLLLASGITSIRDPGNRPDELMERKKRIDNGELLGPRIVPSLLIDGKGPESAQAGVVVSTKEEALAAVHRAKDEGYFGIKIYGTTPVDYVKPMADEAHKLGLHVHGHIPHGMRPLDAVHDGYDEITHINFVMMQAMPDDVVAHSNGMQRFFGPGRYAADVDLHSKMMTDYLDELAARHIETDPTLVTFETLYMPDRGTLPPAEMPYADVLPPQVTRSFLAGSVQPPPDLSRDTMHKSFAKLRDLVAELNRRHVVVLAGTDGLGFDLARELELYVQAGMSPADALATATILPAQTYGLADKTGSIAVGKLAELALVDGDPSRNIGDVRQVEWVMRDGRLMQASALRSAIGISGPAKRS